MFHYRDKDNMQIFLCILTKELILVNSWLSRLSQIKNKSTEKLFIRYMQYKL